MAATTRAEMLCPVGGDISFDPLTGDIVGVVDAPRAPLATKQRISVLLSQSPGSFDPSTGRYYSPDDTFHPTVGVGLQRLVDSLDPQVAASEIRDRVLAGLAIMDDVVAQPAPTVTFTSVDPLAFVVGFTTVTGFVVTLQYP